MKNRSRLLLAFLLMAALFSKGQSPSKSSAEFVPQWAKSAIWYQIFIERFANGDPGNDPKVEDIRGADPQEMPKAWQVSPWGADWYELQAWERENGEPEMWKHLLRRRYGGDLQGVMDRLDHITELGINAVYFNPVFDSPSLHKYDGASYHHIDPNLGPDPEGDRRLMATENPRDPATWVWTKADELALAVIDSLHARGIRVIFDGVFNHMGINSFAWKDVLENQLASPYKDWFEVKSWDDPAAGTEFAYDGWWGVKSLPELKEIDGMIAPGPKAYIYAATERWMNPKGRGAEHGIDGWRLDVAFCVGHPFWKAWRKHVKALNPEAYLTAEIIDVPEKVIPYMQGDEFDAEMNYNFAFSCVEFFIYPDHMRTTATEFDAQLAELRQLYPKGVSQVSMNLFGSHDTNRILSLIKNRGIGSYRDWGSYFGISKALDNPLYSPRKPDAEDVALLKTLVIFQMTYPGAPMIYHGDEVGMWGANDPDCRKPMVWPDLEYEEETHFPNQREHAADVVEVNEDLFAHYKTMVSLRNAHTALQSGSYQTLLADDERDLFGFVREDDAEVVTVVFNNARKKAVVELGPEVRGAESVLAGGRFKDGKKPKVVIPGKWAVVLVQGK